MSGIMTGSEVSEHKYLKTKLLVAAVFLTAGFMVTTHKADAAYNPQPGDVIRTATNPTVFLVDDAGTRIPLSADAYAKRYNNNFSLVKIVTEEELGNWSDSFTLNQDSSVAEGSLIIYGTDKPTIYLVEHGFKRPIASYDKFVQLGYSMSQVQWVGEYTIIPTGMPIY